VETERMIARLAAAAILLIASAVDARAASYLWEVASMTNRVYLYGTVHAGKKDWYPLERAVEDAFAESKVLVVEADILDAEKLRKSALAGTYFPPDALRKHVGADDYARFVKLLPRYRIPEEQVGQLKPFMAVSLLVFSEWARNGFVPDLGVDAYLLKKARAELKPIVEIEGVDVQIALIDSLSEDENRAIFQGTLAALESGLTVDQINGMVGAWRGGDSAGMLEVAQKYNDNVKGAREFEEKFVWSRHEPMLRKIEGYLNDSKERHFIAVGALHLAGPRGLVELLRKRGYLVKQAGAAPAATGLK
jgi:uncharacterized protein YbaP (TraB family)